MAAIERLNDLLQKARKDPDGAVRAQAFRDAARVGAKVTEFFLDLPRDDPDPRVRIVGVELLAECSAPPLVDRIHWLLGYLKDRDEGVRLASVKALGHLEAWRHDTQVIASLHALTGSTSWFRGRGVATVSGSSDPPDPSHPLGGQAPTSDNPQGQLLRDGFDPDNNRHSRAEALKILERLPVPSE